MLTITTVPVTAFMQNARLLIDDVSKNGVIVDPGGDIPMIVKVIPKEVTIDAIWITHSHIDHVSGVSDLVLHLKKLHKAPEIIAHADDEPNRASLPMQSQLMNFPFSGLFEPTRLVSHNDSLTIGEHQFKVLHTPGHALGHVSFYMDSSDNEFNSPMVIAGDTLFKQSIGRTDLPGGNYNQLIESIQNYLFTLPNNTVVCNGHGPSTTISDEKQFNPFLT